MAQFGFDFRIRNMMLTNGKYLIEFELGGFHVPGKDVKHRFLICVAQEIPFCIFTRLMKRSQPVYICRRAQGEHVFMFLLANRCDYFG